MSQQRSKTQMVLCSCGCETQCDDRKVINCRICSNYYLHSCVDLTAAEIKSIKSKVGLSWTCSSCSDLGDTIDELKSAIVDLKKEIADIKGTRTSPDTHVCSETNLSFEEVISEVSEREKRRYNILLHNVPESTAQVPSDRVSSDMNVIRRIMDSLSIQHQSEVLNPVRLGRFNPSSSRPRPIKLRMSTESVVFRMLGQSRKLKETNEFKNIFLSSDKTPKQMAHYNALKLELNRRLEAGEAGIALRYRGGIPRIVQLN